MSDTAEQARRAVKVFSGMQGVLSSFASALSGKRISVVMSEGGTRTDGTTIFYRPALELGKDVDHDRKLCDKRDEWTGMQSCPACAIRERVMASIFHEISHIVFGTMEKTARSLVKYSTPVVESNLTASEVGRWHNALRASMGDADWMMLSGDISPYLPLILNMIEDVRVDTAMFEQRPGTRGMRLGLTRSIFEDGFVDLGGKKTLWVDAPLNTQAIIGCYVRAMEVTDTENWFLPEIEELLEQEDFVRLYPTMKTTSVQKSFEAGVRLLATLHKYGLCDPPQDDDGGNDSSEDEGQPGGESGDSEGSESGDSEGGNNDTDSDEVPEDDKSGSGGSSSDEESDDDSSDSGSSGADDSDESGEAGSDANGGDSGEGDESEQNDSNDSDTDPNSESDADDNQGDPLSEGDKGDRAEDSEVSSDDSDSDSNGGGVDQPESNDESDSDASEGEPEAEDSGPSNNDSLRSRLSAEGMPNFGNEADVQAALNIIHSDSDHTDDLSMTEERDIDRAVNQSLHFDQPSSYITEVKIHDNVDRNSSTPWDGWSYYKKYSGGSLDSIKVDEGILGSALLQTRRAFTDNKQATFERNRRSGRVNKKVLGQRAWSNDDRLFHKKRLPGKKDYAVLIGVDISGSTSTGAIDLIRKCAWAQAELCHRLGIKFALFAHTGQYVDGISNLTLDIYVLKDWDDPWSAVIQDRFAKIGPTAANLDGHTMEFYRKQLDRRTETDKVLMYYTDGDMPMENYAEELNILRREIKECQRRSYTLMAVAIENDEPQAYGLDTVRVDSQNDVKRVVAHLEKRLV